MTTALSSEQETSHALSIPDGRFALVLLALVTAVGALAGVARLVLGLGPTTNLQDTYSWGIWIGFDFTLIAFAGAGFTMAFIVHVLGIHKYEDALRPAVLIGLLGYVAVLLLLVLDLGRPDRFYRFLISWNVHSPLFEISWCILLYTLVLAIEASPFALERLNRPKLLAVVLATMLPVAIAGVTLSSLHQSTLGTLYLNMPHRLHPLWFSPVLSLLFFVSSVMAGLSMAMLTYVAACRVTHRPVKGEVVLGLGRIVAWVSLVYLALKVIDWAWAGELPLLLQLTRPSLLMVVEVGVGVVLPAVLLLVAGRRSKSVEDALPPAEGDETVGVTPVKPTPAATGLTMPLAAAGLILFGVLLNRFSATMFGQMPPDGATYTPHLLEWLSTLGVLAALAMAWYVGIRVLVIFDSKMGTRHHG